MTKRTPKNSATCARAKRKSPTKRARKQDTTARPVGKLGLILDRLEGETGATLDELVDVTGWQKHSVHGALSRLRTRGFAVHLEEKEGRKAYRLAKVEA